MVEKPIEKDAEKCENPIFLNRFPTFDLMIFGLLSISLSLYLYLSISLSLYIYMCVCREKSRRYWVYGWSLSHCGSPSTLRYFPVSPLLEGVPHPWQAPETSAVEHYLPWFPPCTPTQPGTNRWYRLTCSACWTTSTRWPPATSPSSRTQTAWQTSTSARSGALCADWGMGKNFGSWRLAFCALGEFWKADHSNDHLLDAMQDHAASLPRGIQPWDGRDHWSWASHGDGHCWSSPWPPTLALPTHAENVFFSTRRSACALRTLVSATLCRWASPTSLDTAACTPTHRQRTHRPSCLCGSKAPGWLPRVPRVAQEWSLGLAATRGVDWYYDRSPLWRSQSSRCSRLLACWYPRRMGPFLPGRSSLLHLVESPRSCAQGAGALQRAQTSALGRSPMGITFPGTTWIAANPGWQRAPRLLHLGAWWTCSSSSQRHRWAPGRTWSFWGALHMEAANHAAAFPASGHATAEAVSRPFRCWQ